MDIKLPDGNTVTLAYLKAVVEAAQEKFVSGEICFTWPTVLGLLNKLDELDPDKVFTLFWRTGTAQLVTGATVEQACNNAGISGGAIAALDWWARGDDRAKYVWNKEKRYWYAAHNPKGPSRTSAIRASGAPLTLSEILDSELATMNRHIALAQEHIEYAKGYLSDMSNSTGA